MSIILGIIEKSFDTITSLPIDNETYCKIAWTLKIIAQIIEIVLGGILLGTEIAPNLKGESYLESPEDYEDAAYAYIAFFALEITLDILLWIFVVLTNGGGACVGVSVLLSVFFEMPLMISGIYLMKYKGPVDWDEQRFELVFQVWYIVNIMLQITAGLAEVVYYWGIIILAPISYVIACLPYAFVIIPISGWHWFRSLTGYYDNRDSFIEGTYNSTKLETHLMMDFLIVSGFVGQWIWNILLAIIVGSFVLTLCAKCCGEGGSVGPE